MRLCVLPCIFHPEENWISIRWVLANLVRPLVDTTDDAQAEAHRRGLFLYLITSFMCKHNEQRPTSYVGLARNVERRLKQHNGVMPLGPKATRNASRPWRITMIVGPYKRHSRELRHLWRTRSRGVSSRIRFGRELAERTGKKLIDYSPEQGEEVLSEPKKKKRRTESPTDA